MYISVTYVHNIILAVHALLITKIRTMFLLRNYSSSPVPVVTTKARIFLMAIHTNFSTPQLVTYWLVLIWT